MSRIIFAWEMGGGYGHIARDLPLAIACKEAGHSVLFVVRDLLGCLDASRLYGLDFIQAPAAARATANLRSITFSELLWNRGFSNENELRAALLGWGSLYKQTQPDLIVCDFAPRALLAAHMYGIPSVLLSNGFETPTRSSPSPDLSPWQCSRIDLRKALDRQLIDRLNIFIVAAGKKPLNEIWNLYENSPLIIPYHQEFDHYGPRAEAIYLPSSFLPSSATEAVEWLKDCAHIVVYLRNTNPNIHNLLMALSRMNIEAICVIPNAESELEHQFPKLRIFRRAVDLSRLFCDTHLCITHGSGTAAEAVCSGVPVLVSPEVLEQAVAGLRIEGQSFGKLLRGRVTVESCADLIRSTLESAQIKLAISRFMSKCTRSSSEAIIDQLNVLKASLSRG